MNVSIGEQPATASATGGQCPFDHHAIEDAEEAWSLYERLRDAGAVFSSSNGGYWIVSRFAEVRAALRDHLTFSSAGGHRIPAIGAGRSLPIDVDPPEHADYRKLFTDRVTAQTVREMEPFLHELIARLVRDFHRNGGGDFVPAVALAMPLAVLTELVGFSDQTVSRLRVLTEQSWAQVATESLDDARRELREVVRGEVERHRSDRPDDYLTRLLDATVNGKAITDDELERTLLTFAIAGHETTANAASWLLYFLASDPRLQADLRADPGRAGAYVEEALRLGTPAQMFARETTAATTIGECPVPAGERVLLAYGAANRDERQFENADAFDVERGARGHLAFGFGIHQCPGALLARTELRLLLEQIIALPEVRLEGAPAFDGLVGGIHLGPRSLSLRFGEEAAR